MEIDKVKISAKEVANKILSSEPAVAWAWWEWAHEQEIGIYWTIQNLSQDKMLRLASKPINLPDHYKIMKKVLIDTFEGTV